MLQFRKLWVGVKKRMKHAEVLLLILASSMSVALVVATFCCWAALPFQSIQEVVDSRTLEGRNNPGMFNN